LLQRQWSPEQIAGWLQRTYPGEPEKQVSHETIYRSLFIQARGVLKKELLEHLRARRTVRRSRHASMKRNGLGQIKNAVSISERPPSVEDRAVPGHWEGDLIGGSGNSYVATLVERHSRYVMLVKVANKDTESVVSALIKQSQRLPSELYRSLTWDRGKELADHQRLTLATEVGVYFCDPRSPWQRGSGHLGMSQKYQTQTCPVTLVWAEAAALQSGEEAQTGLAPPSVQRVFHRQIDRCP
jgi:IS30 family transposase